MTEYPANFKKTEEELEKLNSAIPELKKAIENLDRTTSRYSLALIFLTILLMALALFQITIMIFPPSTNIDRYVVFGIIMILLAVLSWILPKLLLKNENPGENRE